MGKIHFACGDYTGIIAHKRTEKADSTCSNNNSSTPADVCAAPKTERHSDVSVFGLHAVHLLLAWEGDRTEWREREGR
jgi:hypothetical protein